MTTTTNTDVLVAGAGPTGLVLACELLRRGISSRVIDRDPAYPTSTGDTRCSHAPSRRST